MQLESIQGTSCVISSNHALVENASEEFALFLKELQINRSAFENWRKLHKDTLTLVIDKSPNPSNQIETKWCRRDKNIHLEIGFESSSNSVGTILDRAKPLCEEAELWSNGDKHRLICIQRHPEISDADLGDELINSTMEELSSCYESLSAFYKLGEALLKSEDIAKFIAKALSNLHKVVECDHLKLAFSEDFEPSLKKELASLPCFHAVDRIQSPHEGLVLGGSEEFVWESFGEVADNEELQIFGCGVCCPIRAAEKTLGVLTLARVRNTPYLNAGELNTIRTFADLFGIAIAQTNNAIIRENSLRAVSELEIAADIQKRLLPVPSMPDRGEWKLFAERKSALEVAGDYVDACFDKEGGLYMIIIDVMGKGVSAAFLAAMIRTAFHILLKGNHTLDGLIHALNQTVSRQVNDITIFATCSIAYVPKDHSKIDIVNAGHCPPVVIKRDNKMIEIEASGPPMGLFEDAEYEVETYPLEKSDKILMITDGLYEWEINETTDEIWGWERFIDYLKTSKVVGDPKALWDDLQAKIKEAEQGKPPSDDQTFLYWELSQ